MRSYVLSVGNKYWDGNDFVSLSKALLFGSKRFAAEEAETTWGWIFNDTNYKIVEVNIIVKN